MNKPKKLNPSENHNLYPAIFVAIMIIFSLNAFAFLYVGGIQQPNGLSSIMPLIEIGNGTLPSNNSLASETVITQ